MAKKEKLSPEEHLNQALVKEEEYPYAVPDNWVWTRLGGIIINIKNGTTIQQNKDKIGTPVTRIESIQNYRIDIGRLGYISDVGKLKETDMYIEGNIALSHINSAEHVGKTALVTRDLLPLIHGMNLLKLTFNETCNPYYFFYYSQSYYYKQEILARINMAVNQVSINQRQLQDITIPLPPLPEQQRIVSIIESLFEKLDRAKELAQSALDSFENRKSAILHKAFSGELTRKWREENELVQTANELIEEILLYRKQNKVKSNGQIMKNLSSGIPKEWVITNLGLVVKEFKYGVSEKSDFGYSGIPVIRIPNIVSNILNFTNIKYLNHWDISEENLINKDDLLIVRSNGSRDLVGKCALVLDVEKPYTFASYLIRIRPIKINSKYLFYIMNSSYVKNQLFNKAKSSAGINNINSQELNSLLIPFPPLEEQQEIVRILDNLLENEQKAKELCDVIDQIDHMKKSILARAFRGELGTNNPTEESALGLLKEVLKAKA